MSAPISISTPVAKHQDSTCVDIDNNTWRVNSSKVNECCICYGDLVTKSICNENHGTCQACFTELTLASRNKPTCILCRGSMVPPEQRVEADKQLKKAIDAATFSCTDSQCVWQGKYSQLQDHRLQHTTRGGDISLPLPFQPLSQPVSGNIPDDLPRFATKYSLTCHDKVFGTLTVAPDREMTDHILSNIWTVLFTAKPDTTPPFRQGEALSGEVTLMDKAHTCLARYSTGYSVRGDEKNLLVSSESGLTELTYENSKSFCDLDVIPPVEEGGGCPTLMTGFRTDKERPIGDVTCAVYSGTKKFPMKKRQRTTAFVPQRMSNMALNALSSAHKAPGMKLYLFMGANHERLLGSVCKSGIDSEQFCYASAIDALYAENGDDGYTVRPYSLGGNYLTSQKDEHDQVTTIIQKDPPDDPHPCGFEVHYNLSKDRRCWESIKFIRPNRSEMLMKATEQI